MPLNKVKSAMAGRLEEFKEFGILKGEPVVTGLKKPTKKRGVRILVDGYGEREFIRMNSNSYLNMGLRQDLIKAEEKTAKVLGTGPGAGRSMSGTYKVHRDLEDRLAAFHGKEACMIYSSAYAAVMGTLAALVTKDSIVISDELNHNCIINGIRLSQPKEKKIYKHNDMNELHERIKESIGKCRRLIVVTDGVFSMRGDYAPLGEIADMAEKYDDDFEEGILSIVDDSHGVGTLGETGRGTVEVTGEDRVDILIATLGKALGVNGGYLVSDAVVVEFFKETAPFYVYSNPITPSEANAAIKALDILDSEEGRMMLKSLREMADYFRKGLTDLGYEVIEGMHPIVPLMVRDTKKTRALVAYLKEQGIFSAGVYYPIVPKGDELIRFQVNADHTKEDLDYVLSAIKKFSAG